MVKKLHFGIRQRHLRYGIRRGAIEHRHPEDAPTHNAEDRDQNVDYRTARGLDRSLFQSLATCQWIREHNHLVVVGPTGTGKSWLACALGNRACRDGFSVLYKRVPRLFADLAQARGEGRLARLIAALERVNLLILDGVDGALPHPECYLTTSRR